MIFVRATAFHGAMILVCETKTRFLMPCLSSYRFGLSPLPQGGGKTTANRPKRRLPNVNYTASRGKGKNRAEGILVKREAWNVKREACPPALIALAGLRPSHPETLLWPVSDRAIL